MCLFYLDEALDCYIFCTKKLGQFPSYTVTKAYVLPQDKCRITSVKTQIILIYIFLLTVQLCFHYNVCIRIICTERRLERI